MALINSAKSTKSKTSTAPDKKKKDVDIFDLYRPHSGIRYDLNQTDAKLDAGATKVSLKHTTVEYEPGQDLSAPVIEKKIRYAKQRGRGPVWVFREEIIERQRAQRAKELSAISKARYKRNKKSAKFEDNKIHNLMLENIGPKWYHELSPAQMAYTDSLKDALLKDKKYGTIQNAMDALIGIGLVLLPNHTKVEYCVKNYHLCPIEFLLKIFQLTCPKENIKAGKYTLNDRLILSCITHLTMRQTLRELHLRLPSPPREKIVQKRRRHTYERELLKQRKMKFPSPYLKREIHIPQFHKHEKYMNRHKQWPEHEYFDYVEDMYDISYEEVVKTSEKKKTKMNKPSIYNRPPKIPVRQIKSKVVKNKICKLKSPSRYVSPCEIVYKRSTAQEPEPEPIELILINDDVCRCAAENYNPDTVLDLNIKITTSNEEMTFTQKICPYNPACPVGDLQLKEHKLIKPENGENSKDNATFKQIEYSCECNVCKKPVNILEPCEKKEYTCEECNNDGIEYGKFDKDYKYGEDYGEDGYEDLYDKLNKNLNICQCSSYTEKETDMCQDDDSLSCTCKTSEECTCCVCDQIDKDFLLKLKRYNEINQTNHKPCLCACKCKSPNKKPCCGVPAKDKCKYCFCKYGRKKLETTPETSDDSENSSDKEKKEITPTKSKEFDTKYSNNVSSSFDSTEMIRDECRCEKLYHRFMRSHESCVDLYKDFEEKMKHDVEEYLQEVNNRCFCGDSVSNSEEENEDTTEKKSDDECQCLEALGKRPIPDSSSDNICTCGDSSKEKMCSCGGLCGNIYGLNICECPKTGIETVTCGHQDKIQRENERLKSASKIVVPESSQETTEKTSIPTSTDSNVENTASKTDKNSQLKLQVPYPTPSTSSSEEDSRIFIVKAIPKKRKNQMRLLKKILAKLAEDGYPLAKFPDAHKLPIFKLWFDKRNQKYMSMQDREFLRNLTKIYNGHIFKCKITPDLPKLKWEPSQLKHLTWGAVYKYKKYVNGLKSDFKRELKQIYIERGQEMFPVCFTYLLPTKTFRDCYFTYLPSDENHSFVHRPWMQHEFKDMKKSAC